MSIPEDYEKRVYAGVLGKIIGVYLGRPIEGWGYRDIVKRFGVIDRYVHEDLSVPLVVADDDISGTFTFVRALADHPEARGDVTAEQIGNTWLNYIIDQKTILWWGGVGASTEHTAFKRLSDGIPAPRSGSMALNGQVVAEQIGSQIFIDGWAMVLPGQPDRAAELARRAASVSHDGEAVYAAQVVAAMEAMAFVETDIGRLLDVGVSFIPKSSTIYRLIDELRAFRAKENDWHKAMTDVLERSYGYDKFGGNCHVVPNHGIVIAALLWGDDSFTKSLTIANTLGWDTDCNSANVGCLMGIKNGLAGIDDGYDWRGPVADRLYLPTADGASCISDAVLESDKLIAMGKAMAGLVGAAPKGAARFHFSAPGSVQGFAVTDGSAKLSNDDGRLAIWCNGPAGPRVVTPTFVLLAGKDSNYALLATPTIAAGQLVTASIRADKTEASIFARLTAAYYGENDSPVIIDGPIVAIHGDQATKLQWILPPTEGQPVFEIGVALSSDRAGPFAARLDHLTWTGAPSIELGSPKPTGTMWRRQWVDGLSTFSNGLRTDVATQCFVTIQNNGRGMAMYGGDWRDYSVSVAVTPHLAAAVGVALRVSGLRRYYALLLTVADGQRVARLVKMRDSEQVLAETPFDWRWDSTDTYRMLLSARDQTLTASIDGKRLFSITDEHLPHAAGGIALIIEEGRAAWSSVGIKSCNG